MKKILLILAIGLFITGTALGCIPLKDSIQSSKSVPRHPVKVAILTEDAKYDDSAIRKGFDKSGFEISDIVHIKINLNGCKTIRQVFNRAFETVIPMGPKTADVFIIKTKKLFFDDFMVLTGFVPLSCVEGTYRRFMFLRMDSASWVDHELGHVFFETGRKFDGWYILE